jgi:chemotaxis protein methyltransferase CheR
MSHDLSAPAALISERTGLHFPKDRWPDLAQGLSRAAASLGFENMHHFIAHLLTGPFGQHEVQALATHLTIPETHFFRSPETFAMLQSRLLPELIAAQQDTTRRLRIWSAGCATGQEPYSLAILVSRLIARLDTWNVTILATDINPQGFATASTAEYTEWSFRGTPSWVVNGYFAKTRDGRYRLTPAIREMVTFRYLNLVEDVYPTDCDLILCRNVMMYFSRQTATRVAERLRSSLKEGGYLLVTPSETSRDIQGTLTARTIGGEIVYKKTPPQPAQPVTAESPRSHVPARNDRSHSNRATSPHRSHAGRAAKNDQVPTTRPESRRDPPLTPQPQRGGLRLERRAHARDKQPAERPAERIDSREAAEEARRLADRGDLEQALARCDAALESEKLNPSLYYLKASILQELDRPNEAEQALQSTLFLDDGFALARVMLGAIARSQSRSREAAKHFREALSLLEQMPSDSVLAETNGLTAGEMVETVASLIGSERVS